MAAGDPILDISDLIYLATGGGGGTPEQINFYKSGLRAASAPIAPVVGRMTDLWQWDGFPGGGSGNPTTATVCTNATTGAFQQTTPASGAKKRLMGLVATASIPGTVILYDRLVHSGGITTTGSGATVAQTTNLPTPALTRRTSGVGVEPWWTVYAAIGTTSSAASLSYTNTVPTSGRTTRNVTIGGTGLNVVDRMIPMPLAVGDKGVTAVASLTFTVNTGTAGNVGITLAYPLVVLPIALAGVGVLWSGFMQPGGPLDLEANSDACLAMAWYANSVTVPQIFGQAFFLEK